MHIPSFSPFVVCGLLVLAPIGCSKRTPLSSCKANADCSAGSVCIESTCAKVCTADRDCGNGCCADGACTSACSRHVPEITSVNGTGTADSDTTHASKHLADRLVVTGQNLVGAALNLAGGGRDVELVACGTPTNEQLEVLLPNDVAAGTYTLTATNQAGSCSTTVTLLQGEKGDQGLAGSYVIGDGLAGAGSDLALKSCPDGQILYHASGVWQCALANDALDSSLMPKSKMIWGIVLHNSAVDATHCLVDESSVADTTCTWDGTTHTFTVSTPGRTTHYANDAVVASVGWCSNCGSPANLSVRVDPQGGTDTIIFVVPGWVSGDVRINYIMVTND